jgi:hypothetical protein
MGGQAKLDERPCRLCGEMFLPYRDSFTVCQADPCRKALKAERWAKTSSRPSFKAWRSEYAAGYVESGRARLAQLRSRYGLSQADLTTIIDAAAGRCQCCGRPSEDGPLHLDHCHETGIVRGMLCRQCNTGLGQIGDNEEAAARLLSYLADTTRRMRYVLTGESDER